MNLRKDHYRTVLVSCTSQTTIGRVLCVAETPYCIEVDHFPRGDGAPLAGDRAPRKKLKVLVCHCTSLLVHPCVYVLMRCLNLQEPLALTTKPK